MPCPLGIHVLFGAHAQEFSVNEHILQSPSIKLLSYGHYPRTEMGNNIHAAMYSLQIISQGKLIY